jgi:subtilisin-like proprotein convertase family protein
MRRKPSLWILAGALAAAVTISGARIGALGQQDINGITPEGLAQIEALLREKETRTPAERKIDSQLLYAMRMAQGLPVAPGVQTLEVDIPYAADGHAIVDLKGRLTPELVALAGAVSAESKTFGTDTLQMHIDLAQVETLAGSPDVDWIQPQQRAITARMPAPSSTPLAPASRKAKRAAAIDRLRAALIGKATAARSEDGSAGRPIFPFVAGTGVGAVSSQGDVAHRSAVFRGLTGITGAGVKIGVLSDGVSHLATSQASGDLGPVTVLPGQTGSGDEGTAMLELIHDMAPGAQLYFATAFTGLTQFAQNIRDLRTAGCDIIVDDVFYFVESPFQDGQTVTTNTNGAVVIQAVKDVAAAGALYFSSAGNEGNLTDATAGVWEGDFADGGATGAPLPAGNLHNFAGGQPFNTLTAVGNAINLFWSDPLGASTNDYDLFRLNSAGSVVIAAGTNVQNGTQDPYEQVTANLTDPRIVVVKKTTAAARFLHLNTIRGRLATATAGQTHGHSSTSNQFSFGVGAANAQLAFPNPFSTSTVSETFSSDGPRRIFYTQAGVAITPGNVSSTGGQLLQKPDFTAADGIFDTGPGSFPGTFFGTSAAAPAAAAIAALIKSQNPGFTQAQIRSALIASAIDIEVPGVDRTTGAGVVMAQAPQPTCTFTIASSSSIGAGPAAGSVNVGASTGTCNWVTFANVPWITISNPVGTGNGTVTYTVAANAGAARSGTITVQGGNVVTISQAASAGVPTTFTSTPSLPIPDNTTTNANQTVSGLTLPISKVTVSFWMPHTFDADIDIQLIGPDSTAIPIITNNGGSSDNFGNNCSGSESTYDDSSTTFIAQAAAPFAGTFRPEVPLSAFNGKTGSAANGTWTLRIRDSFSGDTGTLNCWKLNIWTAAPGSQVGDFDGDVKADMTLYRGDGQWSILKSTSNYTSSQVVNWGGPGYVPVYGDYDGDGRQDIAVYQPSTGQWLALKSSTNFTTTFSQTWGGPQYIPEPGDYDGDGRGDLAVYVESTANWLILQSSTNFTTTINQFWGGVGYTPVPGRDFDGDGKADIAVYSESASTWYVLKSSTNYTTSLVVAWGGRGYTLVPGDYDGDRKTDLGLYQRASGNWYVLLSGAGYTTTLNQAWGGLAYDPVPGDYDGDGKTDLGVVQRATGNWYILKSNAGYTTSFNVLGWGTQLDTRIPGAIRVGRDDTRRATDFDGDGKADLTAFHTGTVTGYSLLSGANYTTSLNHVWGAAGFILAPGDYDGDGKVDYGAYQSSTGTFLAGLSSTGYTTLISRTIGGSLYAPAVGDYDGDGKSDMAIYNNTTASWIVLKSSTNFLSTISAAWGGPGFPQAVGDYDGDGKADMGVYQPSTGTWYILLAAANFTTSMSNVVGGPAWGATPGDFDGDGKTDFVVYNATTGQWYGLKSSTAYTTTVNVFWGGPGYSIVQGDYDGDGIVDLAVYTAAGNWSILLSSSNYTTAITKPWGGAGYVPVPKYP